MMTTNALADIINFDEADLDHGSVITNYYAGVTFNGLENPLVTTALFPAPATISGLTITGGASIWDPSGLTAPGESAPHFAVGNGYGDPGDGGILMTFDTELSSLTVTGLDGGNGTT